MTTTTKRQIDSASGAAAVLLLTSALLLPGQPPRAEDSVERLTMLLVDRRMAFLAGSYIAGLGAVAYFWFLGAVRDCLSRGAPGERGTAAFAGALFGITALLLGMAMFDGVAFAAARTGAPGVVRAFTDMGNTTIEMSKFGFAAFLLGVSRSRTARGLLPPWLVRLGVLSAALLLLSAVALFRDRGLFQFGGVVDLGGTIPALVWIAVLSVVMARRPMPAARDGGR